MQSIAIIQRAGGCWRGPSPETVDCSNKVQLPSADLHKSEVNMEKMLEQKRVDQAAMKQAYSLLKDIEKVGIALLTILWMIALKAIA